MIFKRKSEYQKELIYGFRTRPRSIMMWAAIGAVLGVIAWNATPTIVQTIQEAQKAPAKFDTYQSLVIDDTTSQITMSLLDIAPLDEELVPEGSTLYVTGITYNPRPFVQLGNVQIGDANYLVTGKIYAWMPFEDAVSFYNEEAATNHWSLPVIVREGKALNVIDAVTWEILATGPANLEFQTNGTWTGRHVPEIAAAYAAGVSADQANTQQLANDCGNNCQPYTGTRYDFDCGTVGLETTNWSEFVAGTQEYAKSEALRLSLSTIDEVDAPTEEPCGFLDPEPENPAPQQEAPEAPEDSPADDQNEGQTADQASFPS